MCGIAIPKNDTQYERRTCVAEHCSVLQDVAVNFQTMMSSIEGICALQGVAVCCSVLQCVAVTNDDALSKRGACQSVSMPFYIPISISISVSASMSVCGTFIYVT